jgi:hypothetical protein
VISCASQHLLQSSIRILVPANLDYFRAEEQTQLIDLTSLGSQAQGRDLSKQCVRDFLFLRIGTAVDSVP